MKRGAENSQNIRENKIKSWVHKHPNITVTIFCVAIIFVAILAMFIIYEATKPIEVTHTPIKVPTKAKEAPKPIFYSPLTGNIVKTQEETKQAVTAIIIENSPDARPHSGLKQAGIVYEAVTEGGITRLLALYQEAKPSLIGPVRSLRDYFVDWIAAYDASVAHVGGSYVSLQEVRNGNYRDIDQFFNGNYYWRATDRYAPHNVYTSFEKLDELNKALGYTTSNFTGFSRKNSSPAETPTAQEINITFSGYWYNTTYIYDSKSNTYARFISGQQSIDREEGPITPSVLVVLKTNIYNVMQDGWRSHIDTIGTGSAVVFQDGIAIDCTWHKNSKKDPLVLKDNNRAEIKLNRGQTWISVVQDRQGVVTWQ